MNLRVFHDSVWIAAIRNLTPPLAWKGMKRCLQTVGLYEPPVPEERDAAYYDRLFGSDQHYQGDYRKSPYYFLWCVLVDRVVHSGATSVLDVGCGPGQVASFLHDRGLRRYVGIDLSPAATAMAKSKCPDFDFVTASAFDTDVFNSVMYDTVICTEFLEHVMEDVRVLERVKRGTRFFGTVPNFGGDPHVRSFSSCNEVAQRYGGLFRPFSVDVFDSPADSKFFLMDGTRV